MIKFLLSLITDETYLNLWRWMVKKTEGHRVVVIFLVILLTAYLAIVTINTPAWPNWTGLGDKTAWDLADLLLVPVVLAVGGYLLSRIQRKQDREIAERERETDRQIAAEREQEQALQSYIDAMKELLLDRNLLQSAEEDPVRDVAKTLTLSVMKRLDGKRNEVVLRFLTEARIIKPFAPKVEEAKEIETTKAIFNFQEAKLKGVNFKRIFYYRLDLSRANLEGANLEEVYLNGANLNRANLFKTSLKGADLGGANLERANLFKTSLEQANLSGANLKVANLTEANLEGGRGINANFFKATFKGANLRGTNLKEANLKWANFRGANLERANLEQANLSGAVLNGANLTGAKLVEAILVGTIYDKETVWPKGIDCKAAGAILDKF